MCLFINQAKGQPKPEMIPAKKDLIAYACRIRTNDSLIRSPIHQKCVWELGELKEDNCKCELMEVSDKYFHVDENNEIAILKYGNWFIESGGYHHFAKIEDATELFEYLVKKFKDKTFNWYGESVLLCEHVIPMGTFYIEGNTGDMECTTNRTSIFTKKTIFNSILNEFTKEYPSKDNTDDEDIMMEEGD